jgi:hypothetical protein
MSSRDLELFRLDGSYEGVKAAEDFVVAVRSDEFPGEAGGGVLGSTIAEAIGIEEEHLQVAQRLADLLFSARHSSPFHSSAES